jgi:hypothetical protein
MNKYTHGIIGILLLLLIQGCKRDAEIMSLWRAQEIIVDGDGSEWQDNVYYINEKSVSIGAKNDSTDLYLLLQTTDPRIKQLIMRNGLTVWINAEGKKKKSFGIRYPLGLNERLHFRSYDIPGYRDRDEADLLRDQFIKMLAEIELTGPGDDEINKFSKLNPYGIAVGITDTSGSMIYELKIPMVATTGSDYQLGDAPGDVIRVGFETGAIERPEGMRRNSGTGMGGGNST